ncbi:MAG: hypothetical protein K5890_08855 [Bacteroidales bacterium]|nr:hypothetical protein [Bacteroidales bacterium]
MPLPGLLKEKYYLSSIVPEGHPLNNPTQATKERGVGRNDGTDTLSITPHKRRRSVVWGWMTAPIPSRGAGVGIQDAKNLLAAKGRRWKKTLLRDLLMQVWCHQVYNHPK